MYASKYCVTIHEIGPSVCCLQVMLHVWSFLHSTNTSSFISLPPTYVIL
jgi:hypothetical protein